MEKTKLNRSSVTAFLKTVAPARRADSKKLMQLMARASGQPARMWGAFIVGFGSYRYPLASGAEGEAPAIAFSPRSTSLSLYHMDFAANAELVARLGKYSTGKKCLYVARLSEVDLSVLEELCARSYRAVVARHSSKKLRR